MIALEKNKPAKKRAMHGLRQIKASAGSGKTYELTASFLSALDNCALNAPHHSACNLSTVKAPTLLSEVLAITFTNAAATEMRERIIRRLKESALGLETDLDKNKAEAWLKNILQDMKSLNVRTIDSLLHLIVRASALELELNPDFEPDFSTDELFEPVINKYIDQAAAIPQNLAQLEKALGAALDYGDKKGFTSGSVISKRLTNVLEEVLKGEFDQLASYEQIKEKAESVKADLRQVVKKILADVDEKGSIFHENAFKMFTGCLEDSFAGTTSKYRNKTSVAECLSNGNKSQAFTPELEELYSEFKVKLINFEANYLRLRKGLELIVFIGLAKTLVRIFKEENKNSLPATQIPVLAAKVLQSENGVSDALCHLGTRLTHFLVDEFQDTSKEQWEVLRTFVAEGLSRGGSLAWVGDIKQSIYSWRGGDPQLFDSVRDDAELTNIASLHNAEILKTNWRSKKVIVDHNNKIFSLFGDSEFVRNILPALVPKETPEDIIEAGAKKLADIYKSDEVIQECAAEEDENEGLVVGVEVEGGGANDVKSRIWDLICELLKEDIHKRRPWSDVYILCRSNETCRAIAEELIRQGIPVITENGLLLAERSLIIQSVALMEFIANPADNLAFWKIISGDAFLTHPGAAPLNKQLLVDWLVDKDCSKQILFQEFARDFPEQWKRLLLPFYKDGGLVSPYDLIKEWYEWLYIEPRFPEEKVFLRRFLEVVSAAENRGLASVFSFLEYWQKKGLEEKAPLPEGMDAVRIMTIHKAKGLQAPVVIIPMTNFVVSPASVATVIDIDGLSVPALVNEKFTGRPYYESFMHSAQESINLLYVAFTRAMEELYFYVPRYALNKKNVQPALDAALKKVFSACSYTQGAKPPAVKQDSKDAEKSDRQPEIEIPTHEPDKNFIGPIQPWRPMGWLPRLKVFRAHPAEARLTPNERGVFIHFCLEKLAFHGNPDKDAQNALDYGLKHSGIFVPEDEQIRSGLLAAIRWFAAMPQAFGWIKNGWPEHTLVDAKGNVMRADLLVPQADGLLVVDYKTGQEHPEHVRQIQNYIACLKQTGQFKDNIRGLLVYLDLQGFKTINAETAGELVSVCPEA